MLVRDYMTVDMITATPSMLLPEALRLMREHKVHRLPVLQDGLLTGIVSEKDLLYALPPVDEPVSWVEASVRVASLPVEHIMNRDVVTVCPDCPIEAAALRMADHAIGALPVVEETESRQLVGIITETDIFKLFVKMMGSREPGVRISLEINNRKGALASLFNRIVEVGGSVTTVCTFPTASPSRIRVILKILDLDETTMKRLLKPEETVLDIRTMLEPHA